MQSRMVEVPPGFGVRDLSNLEACETKWRERIANLEAALRKIADGYSAEEDGRPQAFRFSQIARKALKD